MIDKDMPADALYIGGEWRGGVAHQLHRHFPPIEVSIVWYMVRQGGRRRGDSAGRRSQSRSGLAPVNARTSVRHIFIASRMASPEMLNALPMCRRATPAKPIVKRSRWRAALPAHFVTLLRFSKLSKMQ